MKRIAALVVLCGGISLGGLRGQELLCDVTINVESIPTAQRDYLQNFEADIERYLNSTRFTDEDMMGDKIVCTIDVFFKSATADNSYQAQFFISSQRPIYAHDAKTDKVSPVLRIMDEKCEFRYQPNQRMVQDDLSFDPLADLLDFYAYLIIGYDLETYTPLSGAKWFQKVLNVVQLGSSSSYGKDWAASSASYSRFGIANELNDGKYDAIRNAFNRYHFDGVDLLQTEQKVALDNMLNAIESINDQRRRLNPTSVVVKQFFDAKFREIADVFIGFGDPSVYDRLSVCDQEHRSTYQEKKTAR
jgi:hypothetical protein